MSMDYVVGVPHQKRLKHYDIPGHAHELTFSCQGRRPLLSNARVCELLAAAIDDARQTHNFELWAYVFMPEHVHLLIMPPPNGTTISAILKSIKQPCSRRAVAWMREHDQPMYRSLEVTRPSGRTEHRLWLQGGGYDRNLKSAETVWNVLNYIHLNPVRRGLVRYASDWYWSSAASHADGREGPIWIDPFLP